MHPQLYTSTHLCSKKLHNISFLVNGIRIKLVQNFIFRPEEKTVEEKVEEALVGVADETGLKQMIDSDEETEEDEEVPEDQRELGNKFT